MTPHPNGYHKSDQAKEACWACSHPEMFDPSPDDEAYVRTLIAEGYRSVSNKYRTVSKYDWPKLDDVIQPQWKGTIVESELQAYFKRHHWYMVRVYGTPLELTPQQFYAFKKAGGRTA